MEFSVCPWDLDISDEAVASFATSGTTAIEPGSPFLLNHSGAEIKDAARRYRAAGIRFYACHAPFGGENDLSLSEEDARQKAVANHQTALELVALAGVECMVIHPSGGHIEPKERPRRREQLMSSLETLVGAAEQAGVRLALENMLPNHVGCESAVVRQIVEHFDSPFLQVCFDTGHAHLNPEGVVAAFDTLREQITTFHLQDNDGNNDRHLQPPYGTIDWAAFVREFDPAAFAFPLSVETSPWNGGDWGVLLREVYALFAEGLLTVRLGDTWVHAICQQCGRYCFGSPENWFCACGNRT